MARLLVSNCTVDPETGGVYLLDTATGTHRRVVDQPARGLTRGPDGYYAAGNNGEIFRIRTDTWTTEQLATLDLKGCHDLRWVRDRFYLVASHGNQVVELAPDLTPRGRYQVVEHDGDVAHPNCLLEWEGRLLLSIFTLSPGTRMEKRSTPAWRHEGKILRLNWEAQSHEILFEPLSQPHSVLEKDGWIFCCESWGHQVVRVDLKTGRKEVLKQLYGFVRGLALTPQANFVGMSEPRSIPWTDRVFRPRRMYCGVIELDPFTWQPRREFRLPGTQVYEILELAPGE